jgi:uncharacterized membrane protein YgcG
VPPPKCFAANMLVISILFAVEGLGIYITANLLVIIILFVVAPFRVQRFWIGRMKTKKQRCEWRKAEPESESESESESEGESERGGGGRRRERGGGGGRGRGWRDRDRDEGQCRRGDIQRDSCADVEEELG